MEMHASSSRARSVAPLKGGHARRARQRVREGLVRGRVACGGGGDEEWQQVLFFRVTGARC
jgi:hypothetical protein